MKSSDSYPINKLLEPIPDTQYPDDPTLEAVAKGFRLAGRARWEAFTNAEEAKHDPLTGLLRKEYWKKDLSKRMESGAAFGIAFMDLDFFKRVNDELGHERGDKLLSDFGNCLNEQFKRKNDMISHDTLIQDPSKEIPHDNRTLGSRYGGDEFSATFNLSENSRRNNHSPYESMSEEMGYMQGVVSDFVDSQSDDIKSKRFDVSIGFAVWDPQNPTSVETLLAEADASMYENKSKNKQTV